MERTLIVEPPEGVGPMDPVRWIDLSAIVRHTDAERARRSYERTFRLFQFFAVAVNACFVGAIVATVLNR